MRHAQVLLAGAAALALTGTQVSPATAVTLGHPQPMKVHSRPRANPPGPLPQTQVMADAPAGLAMAYSGTPTDVLTFHYDHWRTGWNPTETDLTPLALRSGKFGLLKTLNVDGLVLAQPLLVSGFLMPDGRKHDVLVVATEHNSVYAFDARTYAVLWQVNLGPSQSSNDVGCGDVVPEYGIGSTPVIARRGKASATLYVVSATEPSAFVFDTKLHGLDLATGADVATAAEINPRARLSGGRHLGFDHQNQWNRAGLAMANGAIYVSIGSHCDNNAGSISGWMLRYSARLKLLGGFHTIGDHAGYELSSIWMTGFAPAVDAAGDVYAITGNGAYDLERGGHDYGESVIHLKADLSGAADSFTPDNYADLNNGDVDFGSGGLMLIPPQPGQAGPPLAAGIGKASVLYLLNAGHLGGLNSNDAGALQSVQVGGGGVWGGPAYYVGPKGGRLFVQSGGDVLRAYAVHDGASPSLVPAVQGTSGAGYGGSLPIVSSNGAIDHTGIVWLVRRTNPVQLEAYDAGKLGDPIFAANAGNWNNDSNNAFVSPLEANGKVYVGAAGTVSVFGLTP